MPTRPRTTRRQARRRNRSRLGAVMAETVLIAPILMVVIVLIVYLGWNFRRLERITNMDRYESWRQAKPVQISDAQTVPLRRPQQAETLGHRPLSDTFYGDTGDQARRLDHETRHGRTPVGEAYDTLQQQTADETFAYLEGFLESSPTGIYERFEARHDQVSPFLTRFMSDMTRTRTGHRVLNGDWRFANGVRYHDEKQKWEPAGYRTAPNPALRQVFFAELDETLQPYAETNHLAQTIRDFYTAYPNYVGPDVE